MSKQERLARKWAEERMAVHRKVGEDYITEESLAAAEYILATTTPPTMADVEWDRKKHTLAGATLDTGSATHEVVMLAGSRTNVEYTSLDGAYGSGLRSEFTPNGKRYELREVGAGEPDVRRAQALVEELARDHVLNSLTDGELARTMNEVLDALATTTPIEDVEDTDEAKRPVILETLEDYANAPEGTIVAAAQGGPWVKEVGQWFAGDRPATAESIAYQPRIVLRWGWGK